MSVDELGDIDNAIALSGEVIEELFDSGAMCGVDRPPGVRRSAVDPESRR